MKKFLRYIFLRAIVLVIVLILLDLLFTTIYIHKKGIRNKIEFISQVTEKKYDYIFLGSSRVEFHVDTDLIDKENGTKSLNMGISGQDLSETFLLLKLLINKNFKAKKIFIQVDESDMSINKEKAFIGASYFMPYINNDTVKRHLKKYDEDYILDTKIPFFRYMNYGYKIGYRELVMKLKAKSRKAPFFKGLNSVIKNNADSYVFKEEFNNDLVAEIKSFAKKNTVELSFFTSPYFNPKKSEKYKIFAKKNHIVQYIDSIKSYEYFEDYKHLNYKGARIFTEMLIRDFKLNN